MAQYRRFCTETGRAIPKQPDWSAVKGVVPDRWLRGEDSTPVTDVTWTEAQAYCRWAGVELPTDAQWEKAAWGEQGPEANGPSPYGVEDLREVVQQWCRYNPEDLITAPELKKIDPEDVHSIRGAYGPFDPNPREHSSLTRGIHGNGFRCVMKM